jgi:lipopolysaccharide transport system ATP-binding protein
VINYYLSDETAKGIINNHWNFENAPGLEKIKVKSSYIQYEGELLTVKTPFDTVTEFWCLEEGFPVNVSMHLYDMNGLCVYAIATKSIHLKKGIHHAIFHIPANLMNDGIYYISNMFVSDSKSYFFHEHANSFEILEERDSSGWHGKWPGVIRPSYIDTKII